MKSQRRGYTLLETMLAVGLSALLLGLIAAGLRLYTKVVSDRRSDVTNAQVARAVLQQISNDIRAAYYEDPEEADDSLAADDGLGGLDSAAGISDLSGTGAGDGFDSSGFDSGSLGGSTGTSSTGSTGESGTTDATADLTSASVAAIPGIYGNETEIRIDARGSHAHPARYDSIVAAGADPLVANLVSVDRVITYYVRAMDPSELAGTPLEMPTDSLATLGQQTTVLMRRVQKRAEAEYDSEMGSSSLVGDQYVSDRVVGISFQYHDGYDWMDSWDTETMAGIPIAIQVTITVADPTDPDAVITSDNSFQMTVAIPTAVIPEDTSMTGI